MLFEIERVSSRQQPCDEAVPMKMTHVRTGKTESVFGIRIRSLKQLMELAGREGDLIITKSYYDNKTPKIMIYDDYIE